MAGVYMLSQRTLGLLEGWASVSNAVYPEGGLLFTFTSAYRQAHCRSSQLMRSVIAEANGADRQLSDREVGELGHFLQASVAGYSDREVSSGSLDVGRLLLEHLERDLRFNVAALVIDDNSSDMTALLEMAHHSTNNLYVLELWWSVD